jgi:TatD DNase family protein
MIDSHAHLDFPQFDADRPAVIARARQAGVSAIVNVGTNLASSRAALALAAEHPFIYATVGFHPHDAQALTDGALVELRTLAARPKVVAVGEIGLDYYRDYSPRPAQRLAFEALLTLAADVGLPVVVHTREAHDDVLAALRGWKGSAGVVHAYSAGLARLDDVLALGFYVGIAGPVTFPNAGELRTVAAQVPLERLLVETDCPYLTPIPHRGQRNEPAYVRHVVETVARERGLTPEAVARATAGNARRLFGLGSD